MASQIKKIIDRHFKEAQKLINWSKNQCANEKRNELKKYQMMSEKFLEMVIIECTDQDRLIHLTHNVFKRKVQNLLNQLSRKFEQTTKIVKVTLGLFISSDLKNQENIQNKIYQEIEFLHSDEDQEEIGQIEESLQQSQMKFMDQSMDEKLDFTSFLNQIKEAEGEKFTSKESITDKTSETSSKSSLFQKGTTRQPEDIHQLKVKNYLEKLTTPQTELSYLCQNMGWKLTFNEGLSEQGQFGVTADVEFQFKKIKQNMIEKHSAKSKKNARMVASFKMLRKIYLQYPSIWDMYEQIKNKKCLHLQLNESQMFSLIKEKVEQVDKVEVKEEPKKDQYFEKEKKEYIKDISSFKAQANFLSQQNQQVFKFSKAEKMQDANGLWKVKAEVEIYYKQQNQKLTEVVTKKNSKEAEQEISKIFIHKIYDKYREIFTNMSYIKAKKGIKT